MTNYKEMQNKVIKLVEGLGTVPQKINAGGNPFEILKKHHEEKKNEAQDNNRVYICRQWNDFRVASVSWGQISELHWTRVSGGVGSIAPQPFVHGYVWCSDVNGDIAHSCAHGEGPHRIKVCLIKSANPKMWKQILENAGPKPRRARTT